MAERRMFSKKIIDSDPFLDMPATARLLYYDLSMRADDDGFVNSPKKIIRMTGASEDDLRVLIAKQFVIPFESGVVVIKHWKIHNYIQSDRYKETLYLDEKALLSVTETKAYEVKENPCISSVSEVDADCIQDGYKSDTQVRLGKERLDKGSIDKNMADSKPSTARFTPPTLDEVREYCVERNNKVDPERFIDYYTANGWMVGKNPMKNWKATVRNWEKQDAERKNEQKGAQQQGVSNQKKNRFINYTQSEHDFDEIERMERELRDRDFQNMVENEDAEKGEA